MAIKCTPAQLRAEGYRYVESYGHWVDVNGVVLTNIAVDYDSQASTVEDTLKERNKTHGDFTFNADISQGLKNVLHDNAGWFDLMTIHKESLDLIATKISRILSGGHNEIDNWHDIAGYATLVEKWLRKK